MNTKKSLISLLLLIMSFCATAQRSEDYKKMSDDGAWCWFSDPRAVYYKGEAEKMYVAWTTSKGDIVVGTYDYATGEKKEKIVYANFQVDDHTNPSILFMPDGRLMLFFTKHNGTIYYTKSKKPEDITSFESVKEKDMGRMLCYTNPVMLSEENNRIYVFFRGGYDWKPSFISSDDLGETWTDAKVFVAKPGAPELNRPYMKVISDGKSKIHFAFTDGHPRDEYQNSIYYLMYEDGKFYDVKGEQYGDMKLLPINQNTVPRAYDGQKNKVRSWIWDVELDENSKPVMVYTTYPEDSKHYYNRLYWNGDKWINQEICRGGSWFPRFKKNKSMHEAEPHYSGGICLDPQNTNTVYLSRPTGDRFEIEKWDLNSSKNEWTHKKITVDSENDNIRPYVAKNAPLTVSPRLLWMNNKHYVHYLDYNSQLMMDAKGDQLAADLNKQDVMSAMEMVADWQIRNFKKVTHHNLDWTNGALFAGMMEWAKMAEDQKYINWLYGIGRKFQWQPFYRMYHADDIVVSQMYLEMYRLKKNDRILNPTKAKIDWVIANPSKGSLELNYRDLSSLERWSWCDALFMAPPVYAQLGEITGDSKYLKFMHKEFMATYDFLFDEEEDLFFRDHHYFKKKEANGEKIFWGRGNGWVMGGLVAILKELPAKSKYRAFYEDLFKRMAHRVASLQDENGYWHASMLDQVSYPNPETSASGFFCYALAYGVNTGILDKEEYLPKVKKAWTAMVNAVHPDGKLGWVQPIGADPKSVTRDMTEVYGVGAFLLAGSEMYKMTN